MLSAQPSEPQNSPALSRVLVVDDSREGRDALTRVLELRGYAVQAVANGAEALRLMGLDPPPQAVITDLILPDADGREIARAASQLRPPPWVVLTTGWGFEADATELSRYGIHLLMHKPLDIKELCRRLEVATQAESLPG